MHIESFLAARTVRRTSLWLAGAAVAMTALLGLSAHAQDLVLLSLIHI